MQQSTSGLGNQSKKKRLSTRKKSLKNERKITFGSQTQNELIFLVLQGGGGDQPAEEVFKSPHNPFHRGV